MNIRYFTEIVSFILSYSGRVEHPEEQADGVREQEPAAGAGEV